MRELLVLGGEYRSSAYAVLSCKLYFMKKNNKLETVKTKK